MVIYSRHNWFNDNIISYSSIVLIIILGNLLKFLIKINYWLSTSRYLRITSQIQKNLILIQKNQTLITILLVIIVPYWKTEIELGRDFLNFIYKKSSIVIKSYFDRRIRQLVCAHHALIIGHNLCCCNIVKGCSLIDRPLTCSRTLHE